MDDLDDFDVSQDFHRHMLEDAAAAWHMRQQRRQQQTPIPSPAALSSDSSCNQHSLTADGLEPISRPISPLQDGQLPQLSKLLLYNLPSSGKEGRCKQHKVSRSKAGGPDGAAAVSATAAIGGLVALTGSLLSYALARARSSRREHHLKEGLRKKEAALAAMQFELEALKATAQRMLEMEAELTASNTHLLAMNADVEKARAASKRIEGEMTLFHKQLSTLSTTEAEIRSAMAVAEAKALQAEQRRQEAETQRRQAEARWQGAKQQLEQAQSEVETLRGELGLRGSQLEGLTRELEFTRRQLANAEKSVERAHMEARQQRTGYDAWG